MKTPQQSDPCNGVLGHSNYQTCPLKAAHQPQPVADLELRTHIAKIMGYWGMDMDCYPERTEKIIQLIAAHDQQKKQELLAALPDCDKTCHHPNSHKGHDGKWWAGYNAARDDCCQAIQTIMGGEES